MIYVIAALLGTSIALIVGLAAQAMPNRPRTVARRLEEVRRMNVGAFDVQARRSRREKREKLNSLLENFGTSMVMRQSDVSEARALLTYAGYRTPKALPLFMAARFGLPVVLGGLGFMILGLLGAAANQVLLGALAGGIFGWIMPVFYVGRKARARQKELQLALPDALDLLVVCVEAGLGLNQALVRVADEIRHVSMLMSDELSLTNLEIRAGAARDEALRALGERTGVEDIRSLTAILIQTDRFGTSVATALRVQSDTLRTKRRQRAEEAAAKTAIKMVLPLVFCIFPALFVVILGSGMIQIYKTFSGGL